MIVKMRTCDNCGCSFLYKSSTLYKIAPTSKHRTLVFCCYTCWEAGKRKYGCPVRRKVTDK